MKLMTWNIQDGGALDFNVPKISNISNILKVIKEENPDIVVIQEYQSEFYEEFISNGLSKLSYLYTVCKEHPDKTLRKRVLIASKMPFRVLETSTNILDYSRRNWREIIVGDKLIRILGVHIPLATIAEKDNKREKRIFLEALKAKFIEFQKCEYPCMICGDFNLHSNAEYKEYLDIFSTYLTEVTTKEATHGRYKFDYIFVNDAFKKLINTKENFNPHPTIFSDHSYLCVETID